MHTKLRFAALTAMLAWGGTAYAEPIPAMLWIPVDGFENPDLPGDGGNTGNGVIPGWILDWDGSADIFNPTALDFPGEAPEGNNVMRMGRGMAELILPYSLMHGSWELTLMVGDSGIEESTPYRVELVAGDTVLGDGSVVPADGGFTPLSILYTAMESDPLLGQNLAIRIWDFDPTRRTLVYFDDI